MTDTLTGRTSWEARQYEQDRGRRAAMALAFRLVGDFLLTDEHGPVPPPSTVYLPVTRGSEDERIAAVDAWAAEHNVSAGWDGERHHYSARLPFGPVSVMVYAMADVLPPAPVISESELATVAA